ncbi:fimbrillin family protein [Phocaeicola plebeius]|uniref:fimbrillin family protein n=1 Tax=Phocaeicola plebeius TaxID=310297 RepID=UPI00307A749B
MEKKTFASMLFAAAFTLTACTNDDIPAQDNRVALQVTSGIQTRAYGNQWETADRIGIYAFTEGTTTVADGYANIPYITQTSDADVTFAPVGTTIYLPTNGDVRDIVAYYPHKQLSGDEYEVNVTDQSSQKDIDLMAAGTQTADRTDPTVEFSFVHKLSKIEITLQPGSGMTAADLAGLTVALTGQQTAGTFDVTQPASAVTVTTGTATPITLLTNTEGTFAEGIVLPSDDYTGMSLEITLADGESVFTWPLSNATKSQKFEAGKKYLYTINVNKTEISVTATITDWEPGNNGGESGYAE